MTEQSASPSAAQAEARMRAFIHEIETDYDGVQVELSMCRDAGRYTLRVHTLDQVLFADATEAEWRARLDEAVSAGEEDAICPFCSGALARTDALGMGRCPICAARVGDNAEALLGDLVEGALRPAQILWLLARFDSWARIDTRQRLIWVRLPRPVPDEPLADGVLEGTDPNLPTAMEGTSVRPLIAVKHLPEKTATAVHNATSVAALQTALGDEGPRALVMPSCQHCIHSITVPGALDGERRCAYPHLGMLMRSSVTKVLSPEPFAFKPERGTQTPAAVLWNRLLEQLVQSLLPVDAEALEAHFGAPYDRFGGPICPRFSLHAPAARANGLAVPKIDVPVQFNLSNLARRRAESDALRRQSLLSEAETIIDRLRNSWRNSAFFSGDLDDLEMDQLAALVQDKLPPALVKSGSVFRPLRKHFNLRHGDAVELDERLQELVAIDSVDLDSLLAAVDPEAE